MPPSGFSKKAVQGALTFISACYEDLLTEVQSGKHSSIEAAIEFELRQISKALASIHVDAAGKLVKKPNHMS